MGKSHYGAQAFLQNGMELQRAYHFEVSFTWKASTGDSGSGEEMILPTFAAQSVSLPKYTNQGQDVSYGNASIRLPGTINWEEISITFVDAFDANGYSISEYLYSWFKDTVYDFKNDRAGQFDPDSQNSFMQTRKGSPHNVVINEFFPNGEIAKTWTLYGCWIVNVDFGQLDYTSNDKKSITISLSFSAMDMTGYRIKKDTNNEKSNGVKTGGTWGDDLYQNAETIAASAMSGISNFGSGFGAILPSIDQVQSLFASQIKDVFSKPLSKVLEPLSDAYQKISGGIGGVIGGNLNSIMPSGAGGNIGSSNIQTIASNLQSQVQGSITKALGGFAGGKWSFPDWGLFN